jgi:hypothetical protein
VYQPVRYYSCGFNYNSYSLGNIVTTSRPRTNKKNQTNTTTNMPSLRTVTPTVIHTMPSSPKKDRAVLFDKDPVASFSRPVTTTESWAAYHFEAHASKCAYCHNPYEVHRNHDQLCDVGHRLAQEVARYIYNKSDETFSTIVEDNKPVRVEIPSGYVEVASLLKAIERSLRHRSRQPFVSMDRNYYVAPRTSTAVPKRSHSVKVQQESSPRTKASRPRSGEIVDWPGSQTKPKRVLAEISNTPNSKRGSLYEEDLAKQRRNAKHYSVEVREPTSRNLREYHASGYYR